MSRILAFFPKGSLLLHSALGQIKASGASLPPHFLHRVTPMAGSPEKVRCCGNAVIDQASSSNYIWPGQWRHKHSIRENPPPFFASAPKLAFRSRNANNAAPSDWSPSCLR